MTFACSSTSPIRPLPPHSPTVYSPPFEAPAEQEPDPVPVPASTLVYFAELHAALYPSSHSRQVIETPHLRLDGALWRPDTTRISPRPRSSTGLRAMGGLCLVRMTGSWMAAGPGLLHQSQFGIAALGLGEVQAPACGELLWLLPQQAPEASVRSSRA